MDFVIVNFVTTRNAEALNPPLHTFANVILSGIRRIRLNRLAFFNRLNPIPTLKRKRRRGSRSRSRSRPRRKKEEECVQLNQTPV